MAQQPGAEQIMSQSRDLTLIESLGSTITLNINEKNGTSRRRVISMVSGSFPGGTEKRMIKFIEPADVRGTAMLIVDNKNISDDMWIYLPALKKTRRIVSSEKGKSFMSSEFSNADMSSPAPADFTNKHLAGSGEQGQWIIESTPANAEKADEYGYSRKISYITSDRCILKRIEFYNFDNVLFKVLEIKDVFPLEGGKYIIKNMMATNHVNGRSSEILLDKINTSTKIEGSVFSLQNLER